MKPSTLVPWLLIALLVGCGSSRLAVVNPKVDVEVVNQSARPLQNVLARFGDHECKWGNVGKSASYLFYPHPITAHAELHWDTQGQPKMQKFDLRKTYPPGKSGCLAFVIYDDRAEVSFRAHPAAR